jgi:hypothetical protein
LGIELGDAHSGNFLREFKNKGFREPVWTKSDELSDRKQSREETLWDPERSLANLFETRFDLSLAEVEELIRAKLTQENFPNLNRILGNPVSGIRTAGDKVIAVQLSSGEEIECDSLIFADRWSSLPKIQGLPKSPSFARRRDSYGVLQVTFSHTSPIGIDVMEGFYGTMTRESGEDFDRHVWGYFSSDGMKSFWTICFSSDEVEDNHEIAKKLRRMKTTLDKMFTGSSWLPQPEKGFMFNVQDEQVRFEESFIFGSGEPPAEVIQIPEISNLVFMTDGYGPSCSFHQVRLFFGASHSVIATTDALPIDNGFLSTSTQSEDVNVSGSAHL